MLSTGTLRKGLLAAAFASGAAVTRSPQGDLLATAARALQSVVARAQKAEETRLGPDCELCFEGDPETAARARELLARVQRGEVEAFDSLVRRHLARARVVARRLMQDPDDAEVRDEKTVEGYTA